MDLKDNKIDFNNVSYRMMENVVEKRENVYQHFSFFHNSLIFFPNKPLQHKSLENTVGKGEIARVFYPFGGLLANFVKLRCRLQNRSIWKSLKFVVWERLEKMYLSGSFKLLILY